MDQNSLPSERAAVVGVIDPDAYTADTYYTDYIDMSKFRRFMAIVMAGTIGAANGTIDAKLIAYTSSAGAGTKDITGAAITQLTAAGTDSDKQAIINLDTQNLAALTAGTNYTHFRLALTVGAQTSDAGAVVLGFDPIAYPASDSDATTVDEIVSA